MRLLCRVPSLTTPGKSYAIRMFPEGAGCECDAFTYSQEPKTCKHVAIYEAALHAVMRCADAGHGILVPGQEGAASYGICRQCLVDVLAAAATKVRRQYVPASTLAEVKEKAKSKVADIRLALKAKRRKKR